MSNKTVISCVSFVLLLLYVPFQIALWVMLLRQIEATPVMWLIYWINMPLGILATILGAALKTANSKE